MNQFRAIFTVEFAGIVKSKVYIVITAVLAVILALLLSLFLHLLHKLFE